MDDLDDLTGDLTDAMRRALMLLYARHDVPNRQVHVGGDWFASTIPAATAYGLARRRLVRISYRWAWGDSVDLTDIGVDAARQVLVEAALNGHKP